MTDSTNKTEILRMAAELKGLADRLADLAKEEDSETDSEDSTDSSSTSNAVSKDHSMIGRMLAIKMGKK